MKKLFFVLFTGLVLIFALNTLFESDVGDKQKLEYTQSVDVETVAVEVTEITSVRSLLFENYSKEFLIFKNKDLPDIEDLMYLKIQNPTNRTLNKNMPIIFYKTQHGSAGGLSA